MGLLNLGRVEGSQIIQLFGRGVRLRGRDFSLKRSAAGDHPARPRWLPLLETLNVFGIRADFMAAFHKALATEEVVLESVPVPIRIREELLDEGLFVPRVVEGARFRASGSAFEVIPETAPTVHLDLLPRLRRFRSAAGALSAAPATMAGTAPRRLPEDTLHLVDWQAVSLHLVKHANRNGYGNLVLRPDEMRETASRCTLAAGERMFAPRSPADRERLQEVVTALLRTVLDRDFRRRRERWESRRLVFRKLDRTDGNLAFPGGDGNRDGAYTVRTDDRALADDVRRLVAKHGTLGDPGRQGLRRERTLEFARHLYEPLLIHSEDWIAYPPALVGSERRFVEDLRDFWREERKRRPGVEISLLRNLARGAGIGFFRDRGFYPDFILWLKDGGRQHIVFVEPHGMVHADAYAHDEKARLHERLPQLAREAAHRSGMRGVTLDSYIVSTTEFKVLRRKYESDWSREDFAEKHILFFPEPGRRGWPYLTRIFADQLTRRTAG